MTNAKKDNNNIPVILAASSADGSTPVPIKINPTTHGISVDDAGTGSDLSGDNASRDDNGVTIMMGVSSADGVTPCPIYADLSNGKLFIKST